MNINELTLGQIREIQSLISASTENPKTSSLTSTAVRKCVIIKSRNEGISAGLLKYADHTGCVHKNRKER